MKKVVVFLFAILMYLPLFSGQIKTAIFSYPEFTREVRLNSDSKYVCDCWCKGKPVSFWWDDEQMKIDSCASYYVYKNSSIKHNNFDDDKKKFIIYYKKIGVATWRKYSQGKDSTSLINEYPKEVLYRDTLCKDDGLGNIDKYYIYHYFKTR